MKLIFKIQEPANFFHLLESVSQWSIHAREYLKDYYKSKFDITPFDKKVLNEYVKIRKRYTWGELDSDFILARDLKKAKENLKKRLNKEEYKNIKKIISHFAPNILSIYFEQKQKLKKIKKELVDFNKKNNLNLIFSEIGQFYNSKKYPKTIYVHLLINSSEIFLNGGANVFPKKHITIEPRKIGEPRKIMSVIVHEILHIMEGFSPKSDWSNFKKKVEKEKLDFNIMREAIADTLAPGGFLMEKYKLRENTVLQYKEIKISKKNKKEKHYDTIKKLSAHIYPLTKKWIENGKSIWDDGYIDKCIIEYRKLTK